MAKTKKLFVTRVLDDSIVHEVIKNHCTSVLCLENKLSKEHAEFDTIDANIYREEGSVLAHKTLKKKIHEIAAKNKKWFRIDDVEYVLPFVKEMYWSCFKNGYLLKGQKEFDGAVFNPFPLFEQSSKIKNALWIIRHHFALKRRKRPLFFSWSHKICLLVTSELQLELWQNFILELDAKETAILIPQFSMLTKDQVISRIGKDYEIVKDKSVSNHIPKGILKSAFSRHNHFFKLYLQHFEKLAYYHDLRVHLLNSQCETIVVNALENEGASQVLMKKDGAGNLNVINTMNGIKAKTGNNFDSFFTKWIVWDEQMKELLIKGCELPESQFEVYGHLIEDTISKHQNSGKFASVEKSLKNKKVLSVFSARDLRKDKVDGIKAIYEWANNREDIVILYRPHPVEPKKCFVRPNKNQNVEVYFIGEEIPLDKTSLLDQLLLTDISVVFASTVALESKWFGVPCISFEQAKRSLLYCIDEKTIFHSKSKAELISNLEKNLNKKLENDQAKNVAGDYAAFIRSL